MVSRIRLLAAAGALALAACGGGGGGGSTSGPAVVPVTLDGSKVTLAWEQGNKPDEGTMRISTPAGTTSPLYVGISTPDGKPDPNIDRVAVDMQSPTAATIRVIPADRLSAGNYEGKVKILACADPACARPYDGSPFEVGYSFKVEPTSAFDAQPRRLVLQGEVAQTVSGEVSVVLPPGLNGYTVKASDPAIIIDGQEAGRFLVRVQGRAVGTHAATVELTAGAFKRTVRVEHTVTPRHLKLAPAAILFGATSGAPDRTTLQVEQFPENHGEAIAGNDGNPWLTVVPLASGRWRIDAASLPAGRYVGSVSVQSGPDRVTVPVHYTVHPAAGGERDFAIERSDVTLAAPTGSSVVVEQPLGMQRASWSTQPVPTVGYEGAPPGWLVIVPDGSHDRLLFKADPAGLAPGVHRAAVTLSPAWPGKPRRVAVAFTVGDGVAVPAPQVRVQDGASTPGALAGALPVRSTRGTPLAWTASTATPWLRLHSPAGASGSAVEYTIDPAQTEALPAFTDLEGSVTIHAQDDSGAALAPVTAIVVLRREIAEVQAASPGVIVAGADTEIVVRGRGFDRLSSTDLSRLAAGGATVGSVRRLSDTTLNVVLTAPPAGEHVLSLPDAAGRATGSAVVRSIRARALPLAALATGGSVRSVLHDAARGQVFVANTGLGAIQRFRETPAGWTSDRLVLPELFDIGLSPDGSLLLVTERSGRLHLVDPETLVIGATYAAPGPLYPIPSSGHGIAVTNDGRAWLTVAGSAGAGNTMVSFDLRTRRFASERPAGVAATFDGGGPWYETSRNGERLLVAQGSAGTPPPPALYVDMSEGLWRGTPAGLNFFYFSLNGLSDDARRSVVLGNVYDGDFGFVGRPVIPDAGYLDSAAVLSPDGQRLYVFSLPDTWNDATSTALPRIYVFDATAPVMEAGARTHRLPLLGALAVSVYPTCRLQTLSGECGRPMMNIAADGRTLFVGGSANLLVVPVQ